MEGSFETTNEVIVDWIETKLKDVCRCIGLFTNYILLPRNGFIKHSKPYLPLPVVKYVIEDILNCSIVSSNTETVAFPEQFLKKVRSYLKENIVTDVVISSEVVEYIWKYISLGVANLTKDIDINKEIVSKKLRKKADLLDKRKKKIKEFKKATQGVSERELEHIVQHNISEFKKVRSKILSAIKDSQDYITKYQSDTNFRTYSATITLTADDEETLRDVLNIKSKYIKRLTKFYKDIENELNKLMDEGSIDPPTYNNKMIGLLENQIDTLQTIIKDIDRSKQVALIKDISGGDIWEKDYSGINIGITRRFIEQIESTLKEGIREIEDDPDIKKETEKRIMNRIKTRISSFQSHISNRKCDNNTFDNEFDGCIVQSLVYLIVTLTDWLEINYVTSMEFIYALRILLPPDLSYYIKPSGSSVDEKFKISIVKSLQKYNLKIRSEDYDKLDIIPLTIKAIDEIDHTSKEYEKFNNRVRYFANKI